MRINNGKPNFLILTNFSGKTALWLDSQEPFPDHFDQPPNAYPGVTDMILHPASALTIASMVNIKPKKMSGSGTGVLPLAQQALVFVSLVLIRESANLRSKVYKSQ